MAEARRSEVLAIVGATATGKTAVAIEVARRLDGEVVSMDSRQVYRGMDIGTAKPVPVERGGVPHHGFDLVDPAERFSAGQFAVQARKWIADILGRGRTPLVVGGTGFFLRALTHPMFDEPRLDPSLKEAWKRYLADRPSVELTRWAMALDAESAGRVRDRQRLSRLIEIGVLTGKPLSWWQRQVPATTPAIDPAVFVLDLPRDVLHGRIEARVDAMIEAGLVEEVRELMEKGHDGSSPGMNATGYIELIPHIRGERSLEEAVDMIKAATRQYARRQATWLRNQLPPTAVRLDARESAIDLAEAIAGTWRGEAAP